MSERFIEFPHHETGLVEVTLNSQARPSKDVAHGSGEAFGVGDRHAELEIYPAAGVARVTTPDSRIELFRLGGYTITEQPPRIVFDQGEGDDRTRLAIRQDGKLSFTPVLRAPEAPAARETTRGNILAASEATTPPETTTAPPAPMPDTRSPGVPETREETQLLRGRLGRDVWFTSDAERPTGGFPLAVNDEAGGKTIWHRVVTFDETAEGLQEAARAGQIRKGRMVDVMGQPVVRFEETARGGQRRVVEFHAEKVTRVTSTPTRQPKRG